MKLSEDGQDWIPIETNSTNIPREGVQTLNVESEPSPVLPLLGAAAVGVNIGLSLVLMYLLASILIPILAILLTSLLSNNISYTFPALDPSMCPPNSADKCDCSIYDDELDEAKNTQNIAESIFSRASLLLRGGIDGFGNFPYLIEHLTSQGVNFFGD